MKRRKVPQITTFLVSLLLIEVLSVFPAQITPAEETIYVDDDCRPIADSGDRPPAFSIFYSREFVAGESSYWLHGGRYNDGGVLFCISTSDFSNPTPISLSEIKNQFIGTIEQESDKSPIFQIRVVKGNGMNVPFADYRLDLTVPSRPAIALLNEGCCLYPR